MKGVHLLLLYLKGSTARVTKISFLKSWTMNIIWIKSLYFNSQRLPLISEACIVCIQGPDFAFDSTRSTHLLHLLYGENFGFCKMKFLIEKLSLLLEDFSKNEYAKEAGFSLTTVTDEHPEP